MLITGTKDAILSRNFYISKSKTRCLQIYIVIVTTVGSRHRRGNCLFLHLMDHFSVSSPSSSKLCFVSRLNFSKLFFPWKARKIPYGPAVSVHTTDNWHKLTYKDMKPLYNLFVVCWCRFLWVWHAGPCLSAVKVHGWWWWLCWKITFCSCKLALTNIVFSVLCICCNFHWNK